MRQRREYWSRHVAAWRHSGLTRKAYCQRHGLSYWSLCRWAREPSQTAADQRQPLVELARAAGGGRHAESPAAMELLVGERYVLRLWPSVCAAHLREVLAALEEPK